MMMKNNIWMMFFLLKKRMAWYLAILFILYAVITPYQANLLDFFDSREIAEAVFWRSAFLYHNVCVLTFVSLSSMQMLNHEVLEVFKKEKRRIFTILAYMFVVYQIAAMPLYIWYLNVYSDQVGYFIALIVSEMLFVFLYLFLTWVYRRSIVVFFVVFSVMLLFFGQS